MEAEDIATTLGAIAGYVVNVPPARKNPAVGQQWIGREFVSCWHCRGTGVQPMEQADAEQTERVLASLADIDDMANAALARIREMRK